MLRTAILHLFLTGIPRFNTVGHPKALEVRYKAHWRLPWPDFHWQADNSLQNTRLSPIRARPWRANKKQQWLFQSLLLKISVSYRNRTYNRVLGGPRYIHLTKETNAVFPGFFDPLAPATFIYNSITSVMNYLFLISSDFSDFASLSDPQTLPFFFKRVPSWFYLRRRLFYPLN